MRLRHAVLLVHDTPKSDLVHFLDSATPQGSRAATPDAVAERGIDPVRPHAHAAPATPGRSAADRQLGQRVGLQAYDDEQGYAHWPYRRAYLNSSATKLYFCIL
ncbi:hypothetical protein ACQ4V8_10660 [Janthinobacterium sp. LB2P10]